MTSMYSDIRLKAQPRVFDLGYVAERIEIKNDTPHVIRMAGSMFIYAVLEHDQKPEISIAPTSNLVLSGVQVRRFVAWADGECGVMMKTRVKPMEAADAAE